MGERQTHSQPNQQEAPAYDLVPSEEDGQRCSAPRLSSRTILRPPSLAVIAYDALGGPAHNRSDRVPRLHV